MLNRYISDARLYYTGLVCCYECVSASIVTAEFRMLVGDSCAALEGITTLGFQDLTQYGPWSLEFLYRNTSICGLVLRPLLLCHNSDILFQAFIVQFEAFSIIIELSHNFLWEISQILRFDEAKPRIRVFLYKNFSDHGTAQ